MLLWGAFSVGPETVPASIAASAIVRSSPALPQYVRAAAATAAVNEQSQEETS